MSLLFLLVSVNKSVMGNYASTLQKLPNAKIGFSKAMSSGWLSVDKSAEGGTKVFRKVRGAMST